MGWKEKLQSTTPLGLEHNPFLVNSTVHPMLIKNIDTRISKLWTLKTLQMSFSQIGYHGTLTASSQDTDRNFVHSKLSYRLFWLLAIMSLWVKRQKVAALTLLIHNYIAGVLTFYVLTDIMLSLLKWPH